jgi:uncharacterized damage-inducible protein DinB
MNYYGAKELADSFLTVRRNTIIIAEEIGEEQYGFRPAPDARSIGQTLVHISNGPKLQEHVHGTLKIETLGNFNFPQFFMSIQEDEQKPHTKLEILTRLNEGGNSFAHWLRSLSDEFLGERVAMPAGMTPPDKTRFEMIMGVKEHEMHHRAQLMMMQRMIGIVPHLTRQMNERIAAMMAAQGKASA